MIVELWIREVSGSSLALAVGAAMAWSEACGSPLSRGVSWSSCLVVGSAQANFRVLMGKEGMVTIVTGLSTV